MDQLNLKGLDNWTEDQQREAKDVLVDSADVLSKDELDLGKCNILKHNKIKLVVLKQSNIIIELLTSFCCHFIRSLRSVRLTIKNKETYQDDTGVGLVVDKEWGVFRIHM